MRSVPRHDFSADAGVDSTFECFDLNRSSMSEEATTGTELESTTSEAHYGFRRTPELRRLPAATGTPMTL